MMHLNDYETALAASGDLPLFATVRARAHCLVCSACSARVSEFKEDALRVQAAVPGFDLPRAMKWQDIERDMFANIRLSLDVDEIHKSLRPEPPPRLSWRAAVAIGALTTIMFTGWFLAGPGAPSRLRPVPQSFARIDGGKLTLQGDEHGVGLTRSGAGMFIRNVSSPAPMLHVGLEGSLRASSVDQDSGQVSVSQIYVD